MHIVVHLRPLGLRLQVGPMPTKFHLYQLSVQVTLLASTVAWTCESLRAHNLFDDLTLVLCFCAQSPKGDISYLQKFFLMYVGGRVPLHLQEDFCGTALLRSEHC